MFWRFRDAEWLGEKEPWYTLDNPHPTNEVVIWDEYHKKFFPWNSKTKRRLYNNPSKYTE